MRNKLRKLSSKKVEEQVYEWDLNQKMGIMPLGISLTQNIGCVGKKSKNLETPPFFESKNP